MNEEKLNDELKVMLQELRVALPGMQMLFAFLLTIPFAQRFDQTTQLQRSVYGVDLVCTALSSIFLIAPAMYHRVHWRRDVQAKNEMLKTINVMAIVGGVFLTLAMISSMFLVIDFLFGHQVAVLTTAAIALAAIVCWWVVPLARRAHEHRHHHGEEHVTRAPLPPATRAGR